jgi:hypothetical protein
MSYNWTEQHDGRESDSARASAAARTTHGAAYTGRAIDCGSESEERDASASAWRTLRTSERRRTVRHCETYGDQPQSI